MLSKKQFLFHLIVICCLLINTKNCLAQTIKINHNSNLKTVVFGNANITVMLDYNNKANIGSLLVNGQQVILSNKGIYSKISTKEKTYSTLELLATPIVKVAGNIISINGINYGDTKLSINENWKFTVSDSNITFDIDRNLSNTIIAEKISSPVFEFNNMNTGKVPTRIMGDLPGFIFSIIR